jgi:hypothetical protein
MTPPLVEGLERLRGVARSLAWGALVCLVLPALAWLGTTLWQRLAAPAEMHLPGLLTALLVLYVAPVGLVLLVLALAAGAWAWWLGRRR